MEMKLRRFPGTGRFRRSRRHRFVLLAARRACIILCSRLEYGADAAGGPNIARERRIRHCPTGRSAVVIVI